MRVKLREKVLTNHRVLGKCARKTIETLITTGVTEKNFLLSQCNQWSSAHSVVTVHHASSHTSLT